MQLRGGRRARTGRKALISLLAVALTALAVSPRADAGGDAPAGDRARYILPPGQLRRPARPTANSLDQLPLYDALTPLRGNVTDADIEQQLPARELRSPSARPARSRPAGPGTTILYDAVRHRPRHRQDPRRPRLRRRLGDRPRPRPPAPARPGPGPGGGRRRARHQRLLSRHERPVSSCRARRPSARHRPERPDRRDLRRQGPPRSSPTPRPRPTA